MRKKINLLAALFALFVFSSAANAQIVIDEFDVGNDLEVFGLGMDMDQTVDSSILGGTRDESLTVVQPAVGNAVLGTFGFDGDFTIAQGSSDQIQGSLTYSLAGADLTGGGSLDAFFLDITSSDGITISDVLQISVGDSNGVNAIQSVTLPAVAQPVLVGFSGFGALDFTSVDSLALEFDFANAPGGDFSIGSFQAVAIPEPGSLCLLSMTSLVLLRRRRSI